MTLLINKRHTHYAQQPLNTFGFRIINGMKLFIHLCFVVNMLQSTKYICKYLLTYTISIPHSLFSRRQQCFYHLIISRHGKLVKAKRQGFPCPIIYCFPCKTHRRFHEGACRTDGIDSAPPPLLYPAAARLPSLPSPSQAEVFRPDKQHYTIEARGRYVHAWTLGKE